MPAGAARGASRSYSRLRMNPGPALMATAIHTVQTAAQAVGLQLPGICGAFSFTFLAEPFRSLMLSISTPSEKAMPKYT